MKKGAKKRKKFLISKFFVVIVLVFLACFSIFSVITGLFPNKEQKPIYSYNVKRNVDYKVYLKENSFYEEEYLEKDKLYATQIIDYIDIDFDYNLLISNKADFNYSYDIEATIIGEYDNTSSGRAELWKKKYTLLKNKEEKKADTTELSLNQNLKIDYSKYNEVVNEFKKNFKLAIDAYLNIKLNINYEGSLKESDKKVKDTESLEINIPLSKATIGIDTKYVAESDEYFMPEIPDSYNKPKVYAGVLIFVLELVLVWILYDKFFSTKKSLYYKTLDKLLKEYSEIIIEPSTKFVAKDLQIIEIKSFDDIIDIEEEFKSPIMFYDQKEKEESWFIVINGKYAYRYKLNAKSIKE